MAQAPQSPDPQVSAPAPDSVTFKRFNGLKNTVTRENLGPDDLATAVNVDLDDVGQPHRRRGTTQVATGDWHSLYATNDGTILGVCDNSIGIVHPNYSFTPLRSGLGADPTTGVSPLCYVQIGERVYYSSTTDAGIVQLGNAPFVRDWGKPQDFWYSPVVNPTDTLPAIRGTLLGRPPLASQLVAYKGRIYLAQGKTVWCTILFGYELVDKTRNYLPFEADITMLGAVSDGVYVGTTDGLYFCKGTLEAGMARTKVMDSPVIPGSMVVVPGELANPPQSPPTADTQPMVSILFMTESGYCVAKDGGEAYNLTENKFYFPKAISAAAMFRRQDGMNHYVAVTNSGGSPVDGARFGDYVDAEIIRFDPAATQGLWPSHCERVRFRDTVDAACTYGVGAHDTVLLGDSFTVD